MVSPRRYVPGYRVLIARNQLTPLELAVLDEAFVLVPVGRNEAGLTLNLRGPVDHQLESPDRAAVDYQRRTTPTTRPPQNPAALAQGRLTPRRTRQKHAAKLPGSDCRSQRRPILALSRWSANEPGRLAQLPPGGLAKDFEKR